MKPLFFSKNFVIIILSAIILIGGVTIIKVTDFNSYDNLLKGDNNVIVLDAGHGGIDNGVLGVNSKIPEKVFNLKLTYKIKENFEKLGYSVVLTRETDDGLYGTTDKGFKLRDLKKRIEILENAKPIIFISIHMNNYQLKSRRGAQVFYKDGKENKKLANVIQNEINNMKEAPRICHPLKGDYYLLNNSKVPSVIIECGFLSSPEDEKLLLSEEYLNNFSVVVARSSNVYIKKLEKQE